MAVSGWMRGRQLAINGEVMMSGEVHKEVLGDPVVLYRPTIADCKDVVVCNSGMREGVPLRAWRGVARTQVAKPSTASASSD